MERLVLAWVLFLGACASRAESDYEGLRGARFGDANGSLMYRYFVPAKLDPEHPLPLVLYLHSNGRQGTDNEKQVDFRVTHWVEHQLAHPCFVIAPQLPSGQWVKTDPAKGNYNFDEGKPTDAMTLVFELLDLFMKRYPVDRARVYVIGTSLGGFGVWEMLTRRPDLFAAAVPIEGGGDPKWVARYATVPVWAFHGTKDTHVPVAASRTMIAALKAAGGSPKLSEYGDIDHEAAARAFAPATGLDEWLFEQHR